MTENYVSRYRRGRESILLTLLGRSPTTRLIDLFLDNSLFEFTRTEIIQVVGMAKSTMRADGRGMMDRLLEIERKLNITITMPQICHFCGEEIIDKFGDDSRSLVFHSLDGNHENWDPTNKVPAHRGCHSKWHGAQERRYGKLDFGEGRVIWQKKFHQFRGTRMIIIPKTWIDAEERWAGKKMIGVHLTMLDGEIELIPMWEDEG